MIANVAALYVDPRVVSRFWTKVTKSAGCWLWTGSKDRKGYGQLSVGSKCDGSKRPHSAHRISWTLANGDPGELCVLHRCDVPACVRPDHLFLGTVADNNRDMFAKGRACVPSLRGTHNPSARLTQADVRAIRAASEAGATRTELADQFGVHRSTIQLVVSRHNWSHIP